MKREVSINIVDNTDYEVWHGLCLDTGAQTSVIGLKLGKAYCCFMGVKFKPKSNNHLFRFGSDRQPSLRSITIRVPIMHNMVLTEWVDVVKSDFLFLIGLDHLDKFQMIVKNVENVLGCRFIEQNVRLIRKKGHLYLKWQKGHQLL